MHCWRAVAGLLEAFGVPGLQQLVFLGQQALECGKLGVHLGHQRGELFAAERGIVGWHGFLPGWRAGPPFALSYPQVRTRGAVKFLATQRSLEQIAMAFSPNAGKLDAYRSTAVHSGVDAADPHRLVVMLMDGALERIAAASGLMKHGGGVEKAQLLQSRGGHHRRASQQPQSHGGGAIATNLDSLYEYMCQRIMQANASNKPEWLDEVSRLLSEIRSAWLQLPQRAGAGATMSVPASQARQHRAICGWCAARCSRWRPPSRTAAGVASPTPFSPAPRMSRATCANSAGAGCTKK